MNPVLQFTYPLGIMAVLGLVIGLGIYLTRKFKLGWRLYWIGAALLVISQLLHIPFNLLLGRLFNSGYLPTPPAQYQLYFNAIILGLSAGLFEEVTRYIGMRWWAKDARTWAQGLLFGAGWGGMEAFLFFVVVMAINYVVFTALRSVDLASVLTGDQLVQLQVGLNQFWGVPWYDSLLGALERILTLPVQIALTIMVLQVFLRRQSRWLWMAIAWHTLLDMAAVIAVRLWGAYITEGILSIFTLVSIGIIFALREEVPQVTLIESEAGGDDQLDAVSLPPIEETPETIEGTRFTD